MADTKSTSTSAIATAYSAIRSVRRATIDTICAAAGAESVKVAIAYLRVAGGPRSVQHLEHYLYGKGAPVSIDIKQLFAGDVGVRANFFQQVRSQRASGARRGTVPIKQSYFTSSDWVNALGSINLNWAEKDGIVTIQFANLYRWHPEDDRRETQSLHKVLDDLKRTHGAQDFWMSARPIDVSLQQIRTEPPPPPPPALRYLSSATQPALKQLTGGKIFLTV